MAKDKGTNKEHKIRIEASSGLSDQDIQRMKDEAKANEESDKKEREKVDKVNGADSLIFTTEKQLKEYGDKISADNKAAIDSALDKLREAHKSQSVEDIDKYSTDLQTAWQAASADISAAQQGGGAQPNGGEASSAGGAQQEDNGVKDVEFEEVK